MSSDPKDDELTRCLKCGFEAPLDGEDWEVSEHIAVGEIPQCPDCGSTMTTAIGDT